MVLKVSL